MPPADPTTWDRLGENYTFWRAVEYDRFQYQQLFGQVPRPCRLAVDVGCGSGLLTSELAGMCAAVVAFDISWRMLLLARDQLRARGCQNVHLVRAEADRPPLRDGSTDFVLSVNVLHHTDLETSLPALRRLLPPGGRLAAHIVTAMRHPLFNWLPVRVLRSLSAATRSLFRHGFGTGLRFARFFFHPRWLHDYSVPRLTVEELTTTCARLLPGCRITQVWRRGAALAWERPPNP